MRSESKIGVGSFKYRMKGRVEGVIKSMFIKDVVFIKEVEEWRY